MFCVEFYNLFKFRISSVAISAGYIVTPVGGKNELNFLV